MVTSILYQIAHRTISPEDIGKLHGYEPNKSKEIVEEYARRFRNLGLSVPPVKVVPHQDGFRLAYQRLPHSNRIDGGHYRALGAMNAGIPLPVIVLNDDGAFEKVKNFLHPLERAVLVSEEDDELGLFRDDREFRLSCPLVNGFC